MITTDLDTSIEGPSVAFSQGSCPAIWRVTPIERTLVADA